jgi:hypothetical protein
MTGAKQRSLVLLPFEKKAGTQAFGRPSKAQSAEREVRHLCLWTLDELEVLKTGRKPSSVEALRLNLCL